MSPSSPNKMDLSPDQVAEFVERGFVKLPGVIPRFRVDQAVRAINASIGQHGIDPARLPEFRSQSYCPELKKQPVILDLYRETALSKIVSQLIPGAAPIEMSQIALRFPSDGPKEPPPPHIDGMHSPMNGVPEGEIYSFSALAGVFLTDVDDEFAGNFTVWPGTHVLNQDYFRGAGPQSLLRGMPTVALPSPVQIMAKAGDAVIAHYLLSHAVAPNRAIFTRYAIFFRISDAAHASHKWETLTNAWLEWSIGG